MKQHEFGTIVLGSTFFAMGYSMTDQDNTLVIDRTTLIGHEFVDSFFDGCGNNTDVLTEFGQAFKNRLIEKKLIDKEGNIYAAPALFNLCVLIKEKARRNTLLATEVTSIKKEGSGYTLTLYNCEGESRVYTDNIIDTTSEGVHHNYLQDVGGQKFLNAHLILRNDNPKTDSRISKNSFTNTAIFHMPLGLNENWIEARKKLNDIFMNDDNLKNDYSIALTATTFAYKIPPTRCIVSSNFTWIPSCGFDNLLHATDKGASLCL